MFLLFYNTAAVAVRLFGSSAHIIYPIPPNSLCPLLSCLFPPPDYLFTNDVQQTLTLVFSLCTLHLLSSPRPSLSPHLAPHPLHPVLNPRFHLS